MGARPMVRLIQESLKKPLANEILFGKLVHGGHVLVSLDAEDELTFVYGTQHPAHSRREVMSSAQSVL
jgi:ATP-dependent Clp protease ATP-binding subunit ClpA